MQGARSVKRKVKGKILTAIIQIIRRNFSQNFPKDKSVAAYVRKILRPLTFRYITLHHSVISPLQGDIAKGNFRGWRVILPHKTASGTQKKEFTGAGKDSLRFPAPVTVTKG